MKKILVLFVASICMCFYFNVRNINVQARIVDVVIPDTLNVDTVKVDTVENKKLTVEKPNKTYNMEATYYGNNYKGSRRTANGEHFDMNAMTCATPKKFKFGTMLKVTNPDNGKSVVVRVTDRGAKDLYGKIIDLTYGAFGKICEHRKGRIKVIVEEIL